MNKIKLSNNKIIIDPMAVFFVTLITVIDKTGTVPVFLLSALLHETGHIAAILLCKGSINQIKLEPFCLTLERPQTDTSILKDILISASGVFTNFILLLVSVCFYKKTGGSFFMFFSMTNGLIGVYNLLPLSFLDGGELITQAEKLIFKEKARGIIPKAFHISTVILGIITAVLLIVKKNYLYALLCFYPILLNSANKKSKR